MVALLEIIHIRNFRIQFKCFYSKYSDTLVRVFHIDLIMIVTISFVPMTRHHIDQFLYEISPLKEAYFLVLGIIQVTY